MEIKVLNLEEFFSSRVAVLELLIESYCSNFDIPKSMSERLSKEKLDLIPTYFEQKNLFLVGAFEENKLVGFLWLYKHDFFGDPRIHINQIIVDKLYRGRGIGYKLIKEAEILAKQHSIKTIDLLVSETNNKAINMYNNLGFNTERRYMKKEL